MAICDALATLLEPDDRLRDDSRLLPRGGDAWEPGLLYLWPRRETYGPDGQGQLDRRNFALRVAWVAGDDIARAGGSEDRAVSDAIAARVEDMHSVVAANRAADLWEWLQFDAVDYEALRTLADRGVYVDISGWQGPS
jgi:hypothetical protein